MVYDLLIIGAGPGGYSAALRAHQLGAKFALIEKGQLGGTCLNQGCIPTKTLLKSAFVFREVKKAELYGISVQPPILNLEKVLERKNKVVSAIKSGMNAQLKAKGIEVIIGEAKIVGVNEVIVGDRKMEAKNIIIATGSVSAKPPITGIDDNHVIFSDEALLLETIPSTIVIVGGGAIGVEFATLYNQFGSKVCIIEVKDKILSETNDDISDEMTKILKRSGIDIITSAQIKNISEGVVTLEKDGETSERYGEKVLISTGRTAYTQGLFDKGLGIKTHRGYIETDNSMKTSLNNIFAIGDVNGKHMLAHVATAEGIVAVENALGIKSQMSYDAVPRCIYTSPEVASVGISEKEAAASGVEIKTGKYPAKANGRSLADGNVEGFCKVISEKITGKIIGMHIVAPYATEMITEGTLAVNLGIKDADLARIIHPHPTVSEIIAEAASNALLQD